jgi:hypothetical protein
MAADRPNLGLQIALIIFVMLTITLAVTTFIFYKDAEEARVAKVDAEEQLTAANKKREVIEEEAGLLKTLAGKLPADPTSDVMNVYAGDQALYGVTLPDGGKTYPAMLKNIVIEKSKLELDLAQAKLDLEASKQDYVKKIDTERSTITQLKGDYKKQVDVIAGIRDRFTVKAEEYEKKIEASAEIVKKKNTEFSKASDDFERERTQLVGQLTDRQQKLEIATNELGDIHKIDFEAPDGRIVGINQSKRTVWINLGSADGLPRQATFSVYPYDVSNAQDGQAQKKASIQVVRIHSAHLAEARISDDSPTNPLVRDDKIFSPIFHPGKPDKFGIAGTIDLDGDGRSDLSRLIALVKRNGGLVDVAIDDNGVRQGARLTPATKFLVLGERPSDTSNPKVLDEYRKILEEAEANGVRSVSLSDFLVIMGYEGRERSVGLGGRADPDQFKGKKKQPFQRRRPGSAY